MVGSESFTINKLKQESVFDCFKKNQKILLNLSDFIEAAVDLAAFVLLSATFSVSKALESFSFRAKVRSSLDTFFKDDI